MEANVERAVVEFSRASDEGSAPFVELIGRLFAAGVERYHADLVRSEKTYYLPNGDSHVVKVAAVDVPAATELSVAGVESAIRSSQAGTIRYKAFCERVLAAGCVGYVVSLAGRRAVYYGRTGETYVEPFPGAK